MDTIDYDHAPMPELLRAVRQAMGWTQAQLGEVLGTSKPVVASWETRGRAPGLPVPVRFMLRHLARAKLPHKAS